MAAGTADTRGRVTPCSVPGINLRFYSKRVCQFKVQGQSKRLEVIIFNQNFEPQSTLQTLKSQGLTSILPSWDSMASMRSISVFVFILFCLTMLFSNSMCGDIKAADKAKADAKALHRAYEYEEGEAREEIIDEAQSAEPETWRETFCRNQESAIGQIAVLVIVMTAIRVIMTKGMERGNANASRKATAAA